MWLRLRHGGNINNIEDFHLNLAKIYIDEAKSFNCINQNRNKQFSDSKLKIKASSQFSDVYLFFLIYKFNIDIKCYFRRSKGTTLAF